MGKQEIAEIVDFILVGIELIEKRLSEISSGEDFLKNDSNLEKFDAISMRLQSIGECIKKLDRVAPDVLSVSAKREYWSEIIKLREIISHHYINIDVDIVYDIFKNSLKDLKDKIIFIKSYLSKL